MPTYAANSDERQAKFLLPRYKGSNHTLRGKRGDGVAFAATVCQKVPEKFSVTQSALLGLKILQIMVAIFAD